MGNIIPNTHNFINACSKGELMYAKWMLFLNPAINISAYAEKPFRYACSNGHLDVAKWLLQVCPTINISANDEEAFHSACENGHLELAQWLLQVCPTIDISAINEYAFRWACYNCYLHVAQWLFQMAQERGFHIMDNINNGRLGVLLYQICEHGHLDILKWLYHIKQDIPISVSELWQSCRYGHLDMVQWIIQVKSNINISERSERAFRYACERGHLDVAKWLLQVCPNINISANNEYAFRFARKLCVAQWLQQMKPYLYVIEYDEDGNYKDCKIRNKKDANWEQRKYLVWLASEHCPEENKSNLLYRLPSDVSRLLIGFV